MINLATKQNDIPESSVRLKIKWAYNQYKEKHFKFATYFLLGKWQLSKDNYFYLWQLAETCKLELLLKIRFSEESLSLWEGLLQNPVPENLSHISFSSFSTSLSDSGDVFDVKSFKSSSKQMEWNGISISSQPHEQPLRFGGQSPFFIRRWRRFFLSARRQRPAGTL